MSDSEQSTNYAEYSYEKAVTKSDRVKRVLYIVLVVFIMVIPVIAAMLFHVYPIMYVMPLVLILGIPLAKFFFRYFQNEYRYTVDRSNFRMELIHGKAKPKLLYETDVKDMEFAVPVTDASKEEHKASDFDTVSYCVVSDHSPDLYMTSFKTGSGKKVLLYFEGSKKPLKIMNYYNKNVIVSPDLSH